MLETLLVLAIASMSASPLIGQEAGSPPPELSQPSTQGLLAQAEQALEEGRNVDAVRLARAAVEASEQIPSPTALPDALAVLGRALERSATFAEAYDVYARLLALRRAGLAADDPRLADTMNALGRTLARQQRWVEAEPWFRSAYALRRQVLGEDHADTLNAASNIGATLRNLERLDEEEPFVRRVYEGRLRLFGADHPSTLDSLGAIAGLRFEQGRFAEAEEFEVRILAARERVQGLDHADTLGALSSLLTTLQRQGKFDRQEEVLRSALDRREPLGANHPAVLDLVLQLGEFYAARDRGTEAEPLLSRAIAGFGQGDDRLAQESRALGALGTIYYEGGRYEETLPIWIRLRQLNEQRYGPDHIYTLNSASNLGQLHLNLGQVDSALSILAQLVPALIRTVGLDHDSTLAALEGLGGAQHQSGRMTESIETRARIYQALLARDGPLDPDTIWAGLELGNLYVLADRDREAEALLPSLLEDSRNVLGPAHDATMAASFALGQYYRTAGRTEEAVALLSDAVDSLDPANPTVHSSRVVGELGYAYFMAGRYAEAEPLLARAIELGERTRLPADSFSFLLSNLAELYERVGRIEEARNLQERVYASMAAAFGATSFRTQGAAITYAAFLMNHGDLLRSEELLETAIGVHQDTLGLLHPMTLWPQHLLGEVYRLQRRYPEAERLLRETLEARETAPGASRAEALASKSAVAYLLFETGRFREAEGLFAEILSEERVVLGSNHPSYLTTAGRLAAIRLVLGRPQEAVEPAREAVAGIRTRRGNGLNDQRVALSAESEFSQQRGFLLVLPEALWLTASAPADHRSVDEEAYSALQDSMTGVTEGAIARAAVRRFTGTRGEQLRALVEDRERLAADLESSIRSYSAALAADVGGVATERARLRAEQERLQQRLNEISAQLRQEYPDYFSLTSADPLPLLETQALLAADEAVLLIVPTPYGTQVVAVTRDGSHWSRSAWTRDQVDRAARRLLWDAGASVSADAETLATWEREAGPGYPFDRRTAYQLYQQLVAPAAPALAGKRHVFIVGAGVLGSLPFAMLVTEPPSGSDSDPEALRGTHWLGDVHALSQLPTIRSLQHLRAVQSPVDRPAENSFLGFGNPDLDGPAEERGLSRGRERPVMASLFASRRSPTGAGIVNLATLRRMSSLPGTEDELEDMRDALGAPAESLFLSARATEVNFKNANLAQARIIALATHGVMAGEIAGIVEPGLVFTPPREATEADDGYLSSSEIAELRLNADWVVLSACNTAAGDGSSGSSGLSGLARAFFLAGARRLLVSHWYVRDDATARLTARTFELLRDNPGLSRAEAFQRAMREIRDDRSQDDGESWAHPNAWAPFTIVGDGAAR